MKLPGERGMISIIVPCYNEQEALPLFYEEVTKVLADMKTEYEILLIDDGSADGTLSEMKKLAKNDERVRYLAFSRNFGKESAMYAGFCNVKGDFVAVMDADLQDDPALLPEMMHILESDAYDSVAARRISRKGEGRIRSAFSDGFYKLMDSVTEAEIKSGARDFRLMKRKMVDAVVAMSEYNRFTKGIFGWVGFRTYWLDYENRERAAGKTKWGFWKLVGYGIDGIMNFSQSPLSFSSWLGIGMTLFSIVMLLFVIIRRLAFGDPVAGWASIICVMIFIGGLQLFCLGIIGQYIAKIYLETKHRPHYIVSETNMEEAKKIG